MILIQRGNDSITWLEDKPSIWGTGLKGLAALMHFTLPAHRGETARERGRRVKETYATYMHLRKCLI